MIHIKQTDKQVFREAAENPRIKESNLSYIQINFFWFFSFFFFLGAVGGRDGVGQERTKKKRNKNLRKPLRTNHLCMGKLPGKPHKFLSTFFPESLEQLNDKVVLRIVYLLLELTFHFLTLYLILTEKRNTEPFIA